MKRGLFNIKSFILVVTTLLMLMSAATVSARNPRPQPRKTSLLIDPKMYVGKKSWLYTYQFFPELDGRLVDSSKIHKPVPFTHHRFSFFGQGGVSGFRYSSKIIDFEQKGGFGVGATYTYSFNPYFGLKTGFDLIHSHTIATVGAFSDQYTIVDTELDETVYSYSIGTVVEDMKHMQLEFPVMLNFKEKKFDCSVGVKVGVPLKVNYDQQADNIVQTAYYPQYNVKVDESWVLGCGSFPSLSTISSIKQTPVFVMFAGDAQYSIPIGKNYSIGIGGYFDFAFLGISAKKTKDNHFKEIETYDSHSWVTITKTVPVELVSESVLAVKNSSANQKLVSNVLFRNFGLRLIFNLDFGDDKF